VDDDSSKYDFSSSEMKMLRGTKKALAVDAAEGRKLNKSD